MPTISLKDKAAPRAPEAYSGREGSQPMIASGLDARDIDAVKGLLIILIVLGHSHLLAERSPDAVRLLYNFHAAAFLILPFLFRGATLAEVLKNRSVRYLVPFAAAFTLAVLLFNSLIEPGTRLLEICARWAMGLLLATTTSLDAASGLELFWFLPALFGLSLARALTLTGSKPLSAAILVSSLALFASLGATPAFYAHMPTFLVLGLYALLPGLLLQWSSARTNAGWLRLLALPLFVCALVALQVSGRHYNVADLRVPSFADPLGMLLYTVAIVAAVPALGRLVRLLRFSVPMAWLGRRSLQVYLGHMFLLVPAQSFLDGRVPWALAFIASIAVSIGACALAAIGIEASPRLRRLLFPRDLAEWRGAWRAVPHAARSQPAG